MRTTFLNEVLSVRVADAGAQPASVRDRVSLRFRDTEETLLYTVAFRAEKA